LAAEVTSEVEAFLGRQTLQDLDLGALEVAVRQQVLAVAGRLLQRRLNEDASDYTGPRADCACGARAPYAGRREKTFQSVLGPLRLTRAYYHCAACGHGFFPRDSAWGLQDSSLSPAVQRMTALVGALLSFQEGSLLLKELAAVGLPAKRVERCAEALGAEVAADEKQSLEPIDQTPLPTTLYLSLDGTGVPMRCSELFGRAGKQVDGSAKTREVKVCAIWSAESRDKLDRPVRDQGSVTYSAAIESAAMRDTDEQRSEFTDRVLRELMRRRFTQAPRTAAVADLAPWIWNTTRELLPRTTQIADRFHVKEHLSSLAKSLYPADAQQAKAWTQRRYEELDSGRFADLLRAVRRHADSSPEARKCFQYLHHNRERMRYRKFEAEGLCTSSGVIEAGCKVVVGARLKRAGMHWTVRGANAIIALRCSILSGRFQDFWERRSERKAA
jgi:hypothetical protein